MKFSEMLLAGDIGGTKTDLAIYSEDSGPHVPIVEKRFHSARYSSLQAIVSEFLSEVNLRVDRACFDVAGPVINGRVRTTNLPWEMDEAALAGELHLTSVHLMNDLEAVARAVPVLRPVDSVTLNEGEPVQNGAIAVIAPGTGLGESFLTWQGSHYVAHGSEGGHSDFAPTDERQIGLLRYLLKRFEHVGIERVCSGIGIPNLYDYLRDVESIVENPEIAELIATADDRTRAIVDAGLDLQKPSELCKATIELFLSILASEASNLVLKVFATGGIYLAGTLAVRLVRPPQGANFMKAFSNKGRFKQLMSRIPVHVITARAALVGAASFGLERRQDVQQQTGSTLETTITRTLA
jgi:glucokinase